MPLNEVLSIAMLTSFFALLLAGLPVSVTLAVTGFTFGAIGFGFNLFNLLPMRVFGVASNYTLIAIPLFVFMGVMLEKSRLADELMTVIARLAGPLPGGIGIGIVVVGVLMGASTGIVGATVATLGLLTLPAMLQRGYDPGISTGTICASGTLGQILPPSLVLILLSDIMGLSVGSLFAAAVMPGLLLAGLYCLYLLGTGLIRPGRVPPLAAPVRRDGDGRGLLLQVIKVALPPFGLIVAVLGSIIAGVAAPTEAAAMGAIGAIAVTALSRRLSWAVLRDTTRDAAKITASMMFILICAQVFALTFRGLNGEQLVHDLFALLPGGTMTGVLFMMALIFVLGFFIEWIEISYIAVPLFLPVFVAADVDLVWLAVLIAVNLQTSFLTPPFGWALFFLRGVAPPEVPTAAIYAGVLPFVVLQLVGLAAILAWPDIALWLPRQIGW